MDRPTKEVSLPVSRKKAIVYEYYLRGDRKQIEAVMLRGAEFEQDPKTGKPKLKNVDTTYRSQMEDKAVLLGIKELIGEDGKKIEVSIEALDALPEDDFKALQQALPERKPKKK